MCSEEKYLQSKTVLKWPPSKHKGPPWFNMGVWCVFSLCARARVCVCMCVCVRVCAHVFACVCAMCVRLVARTPRPTIARPRKRQWRPLAFDTLHSTLWPIIYQLPVGRSLSLSSLSLFFFSFLFLLSPQTCCLRGRFTGSRRCRYSNSSEIS